MSPRPFDQKFDVAVLAVPPLFNGLSAPCLIFRYGCHALPLQTHSGFGQYALSRPHYYYMVHHSQTLQNSNYFNGKVNENQVLLFKCASETHRSPPFKYSRKLPCVVFLRILMNLRFLHLPNLKPKGQFVSPPGLRNSQGKNLRTHFMMTLFHINSGLLHWGD